MGHPHITETDDGDVLFWVFVQPGATRAQVVGPYIDALRLKVTAPPEKGKANAEVCLLVAAALGIAKGSVRVDLGAHSRRKRIRVVGGLSADGVVLLAGLLGDRGPG